MVEGSDRSTPDASPAVTPSNSTTGVIHLFLLNEDVSQSMY